MDLYSVLGLKPTASPAEIKRAYRRLARRFHPDINPGDPAAAVRFREVSEAYETLVDPERRRRYDERGAVVEERVDAAFGFEGFDFSVEAAEGPRASTFGDLFAEVIQQGYGVAGGREVGADLHARLTVSFEEAVRGGDRSLTVTRLAACPACAGAGTIRTQEARCPACGGSGSVRSARGHMV